jgi:hypothetical protein
MDWSSWMQWSPSGRRAELQRYRDQIRAEAQAFDARRMWAAVYAAGPTGAERSDRAVEMPDENALGEPGALR